MEELKPFVCLNHELIKTKLNVKVFNLSALNLIPEILSKRKRKAWLHEKYCECLKVISGACRDSTL